MSTILLASPPKTWILTLAYLQCLTSAYYSRGVVCLEGQGDIHCWSSKLDHSLHVGPACGAREMYKKTSESILTKKKTSQKSPDTRNRA